MKPTDVDRPFAGSIPHLHEKLLVPLRLNPNRPTLPRGRKRASDRPYSRSLQAPASSRACCVSKVRE